MARPTVATPRYSFGSGTGLAEDTGVVIGSTATHLFAFTGDNGNPGTTVTLDPGGSDELVLTNLFPRIGITSGANVAGWVASLDGLGLNGTYTVQGQTTESTKNIGMVLVVATGAAATIDDSDGSDYNQGNGAIAGVSLTSSGANALLLTTVYVRDTRTVTIGGDLDTEIMDEQAIFAGYFSVSTGAVGSGSVSSAPTLSGNSGFYHMPLILAEGGAVGGGSILPLLMQHYYGGPS